MKHARSLQLGLGLVTYLLISPPLVHADDNRTLESFEAFVKNIVKHGEETISAPRAHKDGGFAKFKWNNSLPPTFDIQRTNSIVTPYIAVLNLSGSTCATKPARSPDSVDENFQCPAANSPNSTGIVQSYRFTLHKGKWILNGAKVDVALFGPAGKGNWGDTNFLPWLFNAEAFEKLQ